MARNQAEDGRRVVGGVDTHKDLHVAAVVDDRDRLLGTGSFPTTRQGYRQMVIEQPEGWKFGLRSLSHPGFPC